MLDISSRDSDHVSSEPLITEVQSRRSKKLPQCPTEPTSAIDFDALSNELKNLDLEEGTNEEEQISSLSPLYGQELESKVKEFNGHVDLQAWSQCHQCLLDLLPIHHSEKTELLYALNDMSTALMGKVISSRIGERAVDNVQASFSRIMEVDDPESQKELSSLLCTFKKLMADKTEMIDSLHSHGGGLILALLLEDIEKDEEAMRLRLIQKSCFILRTSPNLASLYCCASFVLPSSLAASTPEARVLMLDCLIDILSLAALRWDYAKRLEGLIGEGTVLQKWDLLHSLLDDDDDDRQGGGEEESVIIAQASADDWVCQTALSMTRRRILASVEPQRVRDVLLLPLLTRLREVYSEARRQHRSRREAAHLGRCIVNFLSLLQRDVAVDGEVLGNLLPLVFAVVEECADPEVQLVGYMMWFLAVDRTTVTELSWYMAVNFTAFERALKVLGGGGGREGNPLLLRVLLFASTELLRLVGRVGAGEEAEQELRRWKELFLQEMLSCLTRCSHSYDHPGHSLALLEGLYRLLSLYADGYLLMRFLRPLTQALLMQLEEGSITMRILSLRIIRDQLLEQCEEMIHQHACEILAQVTRVYLSVKRHDRIGENDEAGSIMERLCRDIARRLLTHNTKGSGYSDVLTGFIQSLQHQGCPELQSFLMLE